MFGSGTATTATTSTGNNNIDGMMTSNRWASNTVTYSFTDNFANDYESGYPDAYSTTPTHSSSFQTLNATQRSVMRNWAQAYYNVSNLILVEQTGAADRDATIRIAMSNDPNTGYAYTPNPSVQDGDIWFNRTTYNTPVIGNHAYRGLGHELGHALGLKHPHETTDGVRNVAVNADRDSTEFSLMSYRSYVGAPTDGLKNETWSNPQSLMMNDIRAIQQKYGAWFGSNASNTNYTFSTTTGEMFINGVGQGTPGANRVFRTIWDGNGTDTYDFSNYSTNLAIDLTPGGWSDLAVGSNFQRANLDASSSAHYARGHVFNALQYNGDARSLIENANGGSGNDKITGNSANNVINAGAGNDTVFAGDGNDTVDGGSGNDTIYLGGGNDRVDITSTGDDKFYGEAGDDYLDGNTGNETYDGGTGNDTIYGRGGNDIINGGAGKDYMDGGSGIDTIDYSYWAGGGTYNLATGLASFVGFYDEQMLNFENITTGAGADNITGSIGDNVIKAGGGIDTIYAGEGNDTVDGGDGNDIIYLGGGNDRVDISSSGDDTFYGEAGDDYLDGWSGNETYDGGTGNDTIYARGGNDRADGGDGNDIIYLGDGNDRVDISSSGDDTFYGEAGDDYLDGNTGNETYDGGDGNDTIYGRGGNDIINGGAGKDYMDGGSGIDTVDYSYWAGGGTYNLATGLASFVGFYDEQMLNFENITTGAGADNITGSAADNVIKSGDGNDIVDGGNGNDIIYLGAGNDSVNITSLGDDKFYGEAGDDYIDGYSGNESYYGGDGNDTLLGYGGNDIMNGGIGIDKMTGGTGNDTYYIDNVGDVVTETSTVTTEIDTVYASITNTLVLNVERLTLTGTGAINGSGNILSNIITGNGAANTLYGGAGSDTLNGGLGADKFWFKSKTDGVDSIDFKAIEGDKILISASGFGGGLVTGQAINASQLLVSGASVATNTSQRLIYNSTSGGLFFDLDGLGAGASVQFATLSTRPTTLSTSSFVIA